MIKDLISPSIISSVILFFINISFLKILKTKGLIKATFVNTVSIIIFLILKIPVNLEWIKETYKIYPYYHFVYTTIFIFFAARILTTLVVDILIKNILVTPKIFIDILKGIIFFIAVMFLLKANGVSVASIFTTSAVLTAVIGLALQNTLSDMVAGIILSTEDTVKIDNWIKYNDKIGRVVMFSWRYTKIITLENEHYIIPNKDLASNTIKVLSSESFKHYTIIPFGVTYDNIPNKVINVVKEATKDIEDVIDREVYFVKYGDFAIEFEIRLRITDAYKYYQIRSNVLTKVFYALEREEMEIPIPRYDLFRRDYKRISKEDEYNEIKSFFSKIDFIKILTDEELDSIIRAAKYERYANTEYILKQNTENDRFFYIKTGIVSIIVNDAEVAKLKTGNFFGEMSLMTGEKTTATVKADGDVEVYVIKSSAFSEILKNNKKLIDKISEVITQRKLQNEKIVKSKKFKKELDKEKSNLKNKILNFFSIG